MSLAMGNNEQLLLDIKRTL